MLKFYLKNRYLINNINILSMFLLDMVKNFHEEVDMEGKKAKP